MTTKPKTRKALEAISNLGPGQVPRINKKKPIPTRDSRILAAINSGHGLVAASIEVAEADTLGFDDNHLTALIDSLKGEIKDRQQMQRALEAYMKRPGISDVPGFSLGSEQV